MVQNPEMSGKNRPLRRQRLGIGMLMALIAGLSVGLWLATSPANNGGGPGPEKWRMQILLWAAFLLGGLSLVGPPWLLAESRRRRAGPPWGAGKMLWFSSGTASWLLWPPIIVKRVRGVPAGMNNDGTMSAVCYVYGTPLMALYVTLALLAGGWLGKRRRKRLARSWSETFGLILGLAWACTGLYVLELLYESDFFQ
jgi:hypothetical protein